MELKGRMRVGEGRGRDILSAAARCSRERILRALHPAWGARFGPGLRELCAATAAILH